jgi:hypothetical protein
MHCASSFINSFPLTDTVCVYPRTLHVWQNFSSNNVTPPKQTVIDSNNRTRIRNVETRNLYSQIISFSPHHKGNLLTNYWNSHSLSLHRFIFWICVVSDFRNVLNKMVFIRIDLSQDRPHTFRYYKLITLSQLKNQ